MAAKYVFHQDELSGYTPPAHKKVTNVRLVEKEQVNNQFEMILGSAASGGAADLHYHEHAFQIYYILEGSGRVKIGNNPPEAIRPGSVIIIPPKVEHSVWGDGGKKGKVIVIYSPPLSENGFKTKE